MLYVNVESFLSFNTTYNSNISSNFKFIVLKNIFLIYFDIYFSLPPFVYMWTQVKIRVGLARRGPLNKNNISQKTE